MQTRTSILEHRFDGLRIGAGVIEAVLSQGPLVFACREDRDTSLGPLNCSFDQIGGYRILHVHAFDPISSQ